MLVSSINSLLPSNFQQVQKNLIGWAKAVDATRPVTTGDNKMKDGKTDLNPAGLAAVSYTHLW